MNAGRNELLRSHAENQLVKTRAANSLLRSHAVNQLILSDQGGAAGPPADALLYDDASQVFYGDGAYVSKATPPAINFRNFADTITSLIRNAATGIRNWKFLNRSGTLLDTPNFFIKGATADRYYELACDYCASLSTAVSAINTLRATMWDLRSQVTIDSLVMEVTTGTSGNFRFAIYKDNGAGYPGALVYQSPEQTVTAAQSYFVTGLNIQLSPGIYWIAYLTDTANTFRGRLATSGWYNLGVPAVVANTGNALTIAQAYGALPDPFPAGATVLSTTNPLVYGRFV